MSSLRLSPPRLVLRLSLFHRDRPRLCNIMFDCSCTLIFKRAFLFISTDVKRKIRQHVICFLKKKKSLGRVIGCTYSPLCHGRRRKRRALGRRSPTAESTVATRVHVCPDKFGYTTHTHAPSVSDINTRINTHTQGHSSRLM